MIASLLSTHTHTHTPSLLLLRWRQHIRTPVLRCMETHTVRSSKCHVSTTDRSHPLSKPSSYRYYTHTHTHFTRSLTPTNAGISHSPPFICKSPTNLFLCIIHLPSPHCLPVSSQTSIAFIRVPLSSHSVCFHCTLATCFIILVIKMKDR